MKGQDDSPGLWPSRTPLVDVYRRHRPDVLSGTYDPTMAALDHTEALWVTLLDESHPIRMDDAGEVCRASAERLAVGDVRCCPAENDDPGWDVRCCFLECLALGITQDLKDEVRSHMASVLYRPLSAPPVVAADANAADLQACVDLGEVSPRPMLSAANSPRAAVVPFDGDAPAKSKDV